MTPIWSYLELDCVERIAGSEPARPGAQAGCKQPAHHAQVTATCGLNSWFKRGGAGRLGDQAGCEHWAASSPRTGTCNTWLKQLIRKGGSGRSGDQAPASSPRLGTCNTWLEQLIWKRGADRSGDQAHGKLPAHHAQVPATRGFNSWEGGGQVDQVTRYTVNSQLTTHRYLQHVA